MLGHSRHSKVLELSISLLFCPLTVPSGLYHYLGSIVNLSTDTKVHFNEIAKIYINSNNNSSE
jgi:hypothetical protein